MRFFLHCFLQVVAALLLCTCYFFPLIPMLQWTGDSAVSYWIMLAVCYSIAIACMFVAYKWLEE